MTTAAQRLVALSGLGLATAAQHFMAISAGGGGVVVAVEGVLFSFGVGRATAALSHNLIGYTVPITHGRVVPIGGIGTPTPPYYSNAFDLIVVREGVLCVSWGAAALSTAGEDEGVVSLSGTEPAIICLNDAPGATVLTGNDAAFHLS